MGLGNVEDGYLFESRREKRGCLFFSVDSSPSLNSQARQVIFAVISAVVSHNRNVILLWKSRLLLPSKGEDGLFCISYFIFYMLLSRTKKGGQREKTTLCPKDRLKGGKKGVQ